MPTMRHARKPEQEYKNNVTPIRMRGRHSAKSKPSHIDNVYVSHGAHAANRVNSSSGHAGAGSLAQTEIRKASVKRRIITTIVVIIALVLALLAGGYMYFKTTDGNLGFDSSNAADALVNSTEEKQYYILCVADLYMASKLPPSDEDLAVLLVRVDEEAKSLTFVSIPSNLDITYPDGNNYAVGQPPDELGDAGFISAISDFAGVDISHYIYTDAEMLQEMVSRVGTLNVTLDTEIDDPSAGHIVLGAGECELSSEEALVLLRATNVSGGFEQTAKNRVSFFTSLLSSFLSPSGISQASALSDLSKYISTDWASSSLLATCDCLSPFSDVTCMQCVVPYSTSTSVADGKRKLVCNKAMWASVMSAVSQGQDPASVLSGKGQGLSRDCSVEIRNGASIDGAAAALASNLEAQGYRIGDVGNTYDGVVYPDTMVIYTKGENELFAEQVLSDISQGRLVNGGDYYSTSSDVLVIIGADWVS